MSTRMITQKRVLGVAMAVMLAVGSISAVAGSSQAVTTPTVQLSPATGSADGGDTIVVKGKGFADSSGSPLVKRVVFAQTGCADGNPPGGFWYGPTYFNVISATKLVLSTVSFSGIGTTQPYFCLYDAATGAANVIGTARFPISSGPTAGAITPAASGVTTAADIGGTKVSLAGTNFTKSSRATIDGITAKTTFDSATKLSIVLPPHSPGAGYRIKVTGDNGNVRTTGTVTYVHALNATPSGGTGTIKDVISITGKGFDNLTISDSPVASASFVLLVPANTSLANGTDLTVSANLVGTVECISLKRESDTEMSCQLGSNAADGGYTVALITVDSAQKIIAANSSGFSTGATYTVSDF